MSIFGGGGSFGGATVFNNQQQSSFNNAAKQNIEVASPPDDSVSSLEFSPSALPSTYLVAGSWDNNVRFIPINAVLG